MKNLLVSLFLIGFISSCATNSISDKDRVVIINKYLKENNITQVKKITSFNYHGWQSIDNNQLIISTSPNKKFLITLVSVCHGLNFADQILIKQSFSSSLQTRFDSILVPGMHPFKCFIKTINPLNQKQANELINLVRNPVKESKDDEV